LNTQKPILPSSAGFTLIELSLVLLIIGLISGGVLVGMDLIRSAQLRSVARDIEMFQAAINSFRGKYNALPGDIVNATQFWPEENATHAICIVTPSTDTKTCNGNGNGMVEGNTYESFRFWQHLANANLISGTYTGVAGSATIGDHDPNVNAPASKISGAGYSAFWSGNTAGVSSGTSWMFDGIYANVIEFGKCGAWDCILPAITPTEMYSIDLKLDDGKPGMGRVVTRPNDVSGHPECVNGTNSQTSTATYKTDTVTSVACGFIYRQVF
jgi:prepilin-type N-terminal cleavage/methylation domain-containing protein